jgi:threonine dehydrogenase-like Zn-dependent dehydrogenase
VIELTRRNFLKAAGTLTAQSLVATRLHALTAIQDAPTTPVRPNDQIQIALIGAGIQGQGDTKVALQVPGIKLVAVADCYDGRLAHAKELWGANIFTTRDYNHSRSLA